MTVAGNRVVRVGAVVAILIVAGLVILRVGGNEDAGEDAGAPGADPPEADAPTTGSAPGALALHHARYTIVGDELWVYDGLVAPIGTEPPMSSMVSTEWTDNRTVAVYDVDGTLVREMDLDIEAGSGIVEIGDAFYIVDHDGDDDQTVEVQGDLRIRRLVDDVVEAIEFDDLPPSGSEFGPVVIGHADDLLWLDEGMPDGSRRLLAVDLSNGDVSPPIGRPEGTTLWWNEGGFCFHDGWLYLSSGLHSNDEEDVFRVFRRPAGTAEGDWEVFVDLNLGDEVLFGPGLQCLPERDELLVHNLDQSYLVDAKDGSLTRPLWPSDMEGTGHLGIVDGDPVVVTWHVETEYYFRLRGTEWIQLGSAPDAAHLPAVIGGRLVDIGGALKQLPAADAVVPIEF